MTGTTKEARVLLGVALILLVGALSSDLFWFRPAQTRVEELLARRAQAAQSAVEWGATEARSQAFLGYARGMEEPGVDWTQHFRDRDAVEVLESLRVIAGLNRRDLALIGREDVGDFTKTSYYLMLTGTYDRQQSFLRSLEQSIPLVSVESFVLDAADSGGKHVLKINASVYTLRESGR